MRAKFVGEVELPSFHSADGGKAHAGKSHNNKPVRGRRWISSASCASISGRSTPCNCILSFWSLGVILEVAKGPALERWSSGETEARDRMEPGAVLGMAAGCR